jgi:hypothetical protein
MANDYKIWRRFLGGVVAALSASRAIGIRIAEGLRRIA